ncbi:MAG: iron-sulfur cluster assembly scaffold protein [Candidatus Peregrinibacteria bacterium]
MDLYAENILAHAHHPQNTGPLRSATVTHEELNASCGDALTIRIVIEKKRIKKFRWEGTGCVVSQAAMSMLSERLQGMPVQKAKKLQPKDIDHLLGVPIGISRRKCALLCLHALKNALRKWEGLAAQGWRETMDGKE